MQKFLNKKSLDKKYYNFTDDTLVVIPAFNEEPRVIKTINSLLRYFKNIILIDDGSSDKTSKYAENLKIKIINH